MKINFLIFPVFVFFTGICLRPPAQAVPPPPGFTSSVPTCRTNPAAFKPRLAAIKAAPFFQVPLSATTAYVLVVRVDYIDKVMTKTKEQSEDFFNKLNQYYFENSYGILSVSATVTSRVAGGNIGGSGSYRMVQTLATYAKGVCSNYDQIAKDAMTAADVDYDLSDARPDIAGSQPYNHIMIYHAGIGAETANDSGCDTANIWSVFAPTVPLTSSQTEGVRSGAGNLFRYDGISFNGVTVVPESESQNIEPLGVICHEYGHQLGLPDLYRNSSDSVVGKWSLMDAGIYVGSPIGSNPVHLDAWSKQFLGFFKSPTKVSAGDTAVSVALDLALSSSSAFLRIPISGLNGVDGNLEYFLVEKRARSSVTGKTYDNALPLGTLDGGYLIWHINDAIACSESRLVNNDINSGSPTYGVDLVEAAGDGAIAATSGADTDPFPGTRGKWLFAAPFSNSFGGQQTGIALAGFSTGNLVLRKAFTSDSQEVTRTINYPNPGGPTYPQKIGARTGTLTTLTVALTKLPSELQLTIHDMAGFLVRNVPESEIRTNANSMASSKFVYEYEWDGKNDSGDNVASGVYLYRFKVDDFLIKTGKLILVR